MDEEWSITRLAKASGVTVRTLRHYDAVGLLPADRLGAGGVRHYTAASALRLQRILLLRGLGLGLSEIAAVVDEEKDAVEALRTHLDGLLAERRRVERLVETVTATIAHLEGERDMALEELFDGIDPARQAAYEAELVDRYGDEARQQIAESRRRTAGWDRARADEAVAEYEAVEDAAVELIEAGAAPDDPRAVELMDRQYRAVCAFWTPNRASFTGLGRMYADSPEFRARYDAKHPRMAEFLATAMAAYAEQRLD
ncbi:TipAS antibiotic-recognition domain-containing protein [Streptomyces sp. NPDC056600]|uniref:MerR family transcriptional regulator n=1 Tax=Streptomyces sp. NPDC056600 TaxID=3345874 RepID=UPI0036AF3C46